MTSVEGGDLAANVNPGEHLRVVDLLVEQVVYDGDAGSVAITFRTSGIKTLAAEIATNQEEAA